MVRLASALLWAAGLLVLFPNSSSAEFFKSGYPACDSREHLDQFLAIKSGNNAKFFEYTIDRHWCIYPRELVVRIITVTSDGRALIGFEGTDLKLWSLTKAIGIHRQPAAENIIIEDPLNPDGRSVCQMISFRTRKPGGPADAMLRSLISFVPSSEQKRYEQPIRNDEYDLITDWTEGNCLAALYVLREKPVTCVVDYLKYYRCRRDKSDDADMDCYRDLCRASTSRQH